MWPAPLQPAAIHIWHVELDQPDSLLEEFSRTLAADELARAARFHFDGDRRHFVAARGFLRAVLGSYLRLSPSDVQFTYGEHGKPRLADSAQDRQLTFNLSHSGNVAMLALADGRPVGVDLELMRPLPVVEAVAPTIFSEGDLAVFNALSDAPRQQAFFDAWSRKEALVKAIGAGFSMSVKDVEVTFLPNAPARLVRLHRSTTLAAEWTLRQVDAPTGYRAALAVSGSPARFCQRAWLAAASPRAAQP